MQNLIISLILDSDSYKASHYLQYPPGTRYVSSYIEARIPFPRKKNLINNVVEGCVFLGLQYFIQKYLMTPITHADILEAQEILTAHGEPFNFDGWMHILKEHGGYMPLEIQALPEGMIVPAQIPMVQVRNTDPVVPWLTSYVETALLRSIWYPTTVATQAREIKIVLRDYLMRCGEPLDGLDFMLHDFGSRGVSSQESAGIGGFAHLTQFKGTDTLAGLMFARQFYDAGVCGYSVPAAEHSTITSWGRDREIDAYRAMIALAKQYKIASAVSDSYDVYNAVDNVQGKELHDEIVALGEVGAKFVQRPDSGMPKQVVPKLLKLDEKNFGITKNKLGYKKLPSYLAVLQGDGVNYNSIDRIVKAAMDANFTPNNLVFGMGGAGLQQVNRDTLSFAMKANAIDLGDGWTDVYKKPVTDSGKSSKAGRQAVIYNDGKFYSIRNVTSLPSADNILQTVYIDGVMKVSVNMETIRNRSSV